MEKINTPLGELLEELKDQQSKIPENSKESLYWRGRNEQIDVIISLIEYKLQPEREVMIKCAEYDVSYMALKMHGTDHEQDCECEDCADMQHETAVAYVNENFKSYE